MIARGSPCQATSWRHSRSRLIHSSSQRSAHSAGTLVAGASLIAALGDLASSRSIVATSGWHHSSDVVRRPVGRRSGSMCQASMPSKSKSATSIVRYDGAGVERREVGDDYGIEIDADARIAAVFARVASRVAADAAAEVGDDRASRGR